MRSTRAAFLAGLILLLVGNAQRSEANISPNTDATWALPTAPDASALGNNFPKCDMGGSIAVLSECLSDLEVFRSLKLEQYNQDVKDYIKALKRLDKRVELGHATRKLPDDQYSDVHDDISDGFTKSSEHGIYMTAYYTFAHKYSEQVEIIQRQIKCRRYAGGANCTT